MTGASGNLGRVLVERLQRAGVVVVPLTHKDADLSQEPQVEAAYDRALQRNGAIWGSVQVAGGWAPGTVAQTSVEVFERMIDVNLRSAFLCCRAALRRMTKAIAEEGGGVRANCVAPGAMKTPANGDLPGQVPLEDVAEGILYLLSPESGAVNGAVLTFPSR